MSTPISPRPSNSLKQKVSAGKVPPDKRGAQKEASAQKEEKMTQIVESVGKVFAFTIDATTAEVVKLETLDASGARRELSEEEKATLAQAGTEGGLEEFVARAFEAGIGCVLGDDEREDKTDEPVEDAELRHLLLAPLIEQSPAKRLVQREALNRAILGTLIRHATQKAPAPAAAASSPSAGPQSDRAAPARAN
jgi:hypothetical protein